MASTTSYSQLFADCQRETEDTSEEFTTEFPRLLADVQDRLQRDLDLRIFHVYASATLSAGSNSETLESASWLRVDNIIHSDGEPMEERDYTFLRMCGTGTGRPRYYARDTETTIYMWPKPDQDYTVTFDALARMSALALTTNETNWLTNNVADLYLVAALAESERFLKSMARAADYEQQYQRLLGEVKRELSHREATPKHASTANPMMEAREG